MFPGPPHWAKLTSAGQWQSHVACRRHTDALFRFALIAALQTRFSVPAIAPIIDPVKKEALSIMKLPVTERTSFHLLIAKQLKCGSIAFSQWFFGSITNGS
jgi:hypothetical protein